MAVMGGAVLVSLVYVLVRVPWLLHRGELERPRRKPRAR
jgi:hypothetical protein